MMTMQNDYASKYLLKLLSFYHYRFLFLNLDITRASSY